MTGGRRWRLAVLLAVQGGREINQRRLITAKGCRHGLRWAVGYRAMWANDHRRVLGDASQGNRERALRTSREVDKKKRKRRESMKKKKKEKSWALLDSPERTEKRWYKRAEKATTGTSKRNTAGPNRI